MINERHVNTMWGSWRRLKATDVPALLRMSMRAAHTDAHCSPEANPLAHPTPTLVRRPFSAAHPTAASARLRCSRNRAPFLLTLPSILAQLGRPVPEHHPSA